MAGGVNKVILLGNLGRDAEMRFTPGGMAIATLRLATTERRKDKEGAWKDHTEWHRVLLFGKTAETIQEYLTKGKQIYVEGRIQYREWEPKGGGEKKYMTEILGDRVVLLGGGGGARSGGGMARGGSEPVDQPGPAETELTDDDIPF